MTTIVPTASFETITSHSLPSGCGLLTEEESKEFRRKVTEGLIDHLANTGILAEIEAQNAKRIRGEELLKEMAELAIESKKLDVKILTKFFYAIFSKEPLLLNDADSLFYTYLNNDCLTVEESEEKKSFVRINNMKPIIDYLSQHPDVRMCNFRSFKREVHDIPTLAEYLKTSNITAVGLNSGISEESKALLAEAVAVRNGTLKIFYAA